MSTATVNPPTTLTDDAQLLIDTRLDTIERMLLGQMSRSDRLAIVREVEAQIHDLLAGRNPADTDRDAVITVLARLDPPEAYLQHEPDGMVRHSTGAARSLGSVVARPKPVTGSVVKPPGTIAGKTSGILGIISLFLTGSTLISFLILVQGKADYSWVFLLWGLSFTNLTLSLLALVFSAYARFIGNWAIVGLVTGVICFLSCVSGGLFMLLG